MASAKIKLPSGKYVTKKGHWVNIKNRYVKRIYIKAIIRGGKFAGWKTLKTEMHKNWKLR